MGGFIESFKAGLSEPSGPGPYKVAGLAVTCPHCGGRAFDEGSALLNTAGLTFLNLDFVNREAFLLECAKCGRIEWFMREPVRE